MRGKIFISTAIVIAACLLIASFVFAQDDKAAIKEEKAIIKKDKVIEKVEETLDLLYERQPGSEAAIKRSAGYAVLNNFGTKIFVAGGGSGRGIAFNNQTGEATFMRMLEVQGGLGIGIKKYRLIFVFQDIAKFNKFVESGWQIGAQANATLELNEKGGGLAGAVTLEPGVSLYQLSDDGLALELTVKGTKYFKDKKLNALE